MTNENKRDLKRVGVFLSLLVCVLWYVFAVKALPVATPVHFAWGWTVDSAHFVHTIDSVRTDSSSKRYNITEWPDTTFDLTMGGRHEILMYYWVGNQDSALWTKTYDYYDYNHANCAGGGMYVAGFWIWDTTNDLGIARVPVTINRDSSMGPMHLWERAEANGYIEFGLNDGDYSLIASIAGYGFPTYDFTISGAHLLDTIKGYEIPLPPAADSAPYVVAYYDGGAGFIDSATGLMIARTNVTYHMEPVGVHAMADGSWGILPKLESKRPDANGRVSFRLVANLFLTPPTSYYRFWFEARDGTTRVRRTIRNFIVDSLPDPVNILQTTETFPGNY